MRPASRSLRLDNPRRQDGLYHPGRPCRDGKQHDWGARPGRDGGSQAPGSALWAASGNLVRYRPENNAGAAHARGRVSGHRKAIPGLSHPGNANLPRECVKKAPQNPEPLNTVKSVVYAYICMQVNKAHLYLRCLLEFKAAK